MDGAGSGVLVRGGPGRRSAGGGRSAAAGRGDPGGSRARIRQVDGKGAGPGQRRLRGGRRDGDVAGCRRRARRPGAHGDDHERRCLDRCRRSHGRDAEPRGRHPRHAGLRVRRPHPGVRRRARGAAGLRAGVRGGTRAGPPAAAGQCARRRRHHARSLEPATAAAEDSGDARGSRPGRPGCCGYGRGACPPASNSGRRTWGGASAPPSWRL